MRWHEFPLGEIVDRLAYPDEKKLIARTNAANRVSCAMKKLVAALAALLLSMIALPAIPCSNSCYSNC